jgi:3-phenylpropionate/trans-cinnamate dioxygenase ferredoxin subunit
LQQNLHFEGESFISNDSRAVRNVFRRLLRPDRPIRTPADADHASVTGIGAPLAASPMEGRPMTKRSVTIAKATDIPPDELVLYDVEGVRVAVANVNGRFYAIDDTCTHEQCSLALEGTLEGTVVTCGCHGAQFDVTSGDVLAPPALEPVQAYPIRVEQGNLVVEI